MLEIVSQVLQNFCAPLAEIVVQVESEQTSVLCTGFNLEHAVLLLCPIFTQRPRHD